MIATKIKAGDLMKTEVETIDTGMPVHDAIRFLEESQISGVPVVDTGNKVVGVLSLRDLVKAAEAERTSEDRPDYYLPEPTEEGFDTEPDEFFSKAGYSPEIDAGSTVAEWMTEQIVAVKPEDSARVVCKRMTENHIHRVLVLDHGRLCGIITSSDIVRHIAEHG